MLIDLVRRLFGSQTKAPVDFSCDDGPCPLYSAALRIVHPITSYFVMDSFDKQHDTLFQWSQGLSDQHMQFHMLFWLEYARQNNVKHQEDKLRQMSTDELVKEFNPPTI